MEIYAERYRSGHNEAVLKTVWGKPHKGSNPFLSARYLKAYCKAFYRLQCAFAVFGDLLKRCLQSIFIKKIKMRVKMRPRQLQIESKM